MAVLLDILVLSVASYAEPSGEQVLQQLEQRLASANTLTVEFEIDVLRRWRHSRFNYIFDPEGAALSSKLRKVEGRFKGVLKIQRRGRKLRYEWDGTMTCDTTDGEMGVQTRLLRVSDGRRLVSDWSAMGPGSEYAGLVTRGRHDWIAKPHRDLPRVLQMHAGRSGMSASSGLWRTFKRRFDLDERQPVSPVRVIANQKLGDREVQVLEFRLKTADDPDSGYDVKLWLDQQTGLPLQRINRFPRVTITETYSRFTIDEPIRPEDFDIPDHYDGLKPGDIVR